ncbi:hypothetical protein DL96DRAFT_1627094 [Flagelloscypha sp. PMI_526]|nr:hypothetical protein DL96DRAFT_1627094 [Flagelloscypha sp. PMI_526]
MSATNANLSVISSLMEPLPLDIVLTIIDFSLSSSPGYGIVLQFSLLSRAVYQRMLPRLYHTLEFRKFDITSPEPETIDKNVLLACAPTSSLQFTRRILSPDSDSPLPFSLFSQLTHLSLWGRNCLDMEPHGTQQAQAIVMLPLEELVVSEYQDNCALLQVLTEDTTIWKTLQRFTCLSYKESSRADEGWLKCPNIAMVFILCIKVEWFIETQIDDVVLPSSPTFQFYIIAPIVGSSTLPPGDSLELSIKDPRIVILRKAPRHFAERSESFWDYHSDMWKVAQHMIKKNVDTKETRVIKKLPWSKVKGCYVIS